jgi:hypothetical protein
MNNPFDQQPVVPAVNLGEVHSTVPDADEMSYVPDFSGDSVTPGVGSSGGKKKRLLLLLLLVLLLLGAGFFVFMSSDSSPELPVAPVAAPADTQPLTPPASPAEPQPLTPPADPAVSGAVAPAAVHPCEQRMIDYANQNGADAKLYVEQNQAYLAECKKAMDAGAN